MEKPLEQTIRAIFGGLSAQPKQKNARLVENWHKIVGSGIAERTTPRFGKSSVVVWADNSPLAYELSQKYGAAILKRLQHEFGESEVKKVWFRAGAPN